MGGISKEARDRLAGRLQKNKDRIVLQASSKDKEREKDRDYNEKNYDKHRYSRDKERGSRERGKEDVICFA